MISESCKVCPDIIPACAPCQSGETCVLIAQSCNVCAYTSCIPNAEVSSGHYTIESTADLSSLSNIISGTRGSDTSTSTGSGSAAGSTTSSGTTTGISSQTTSSSQPTSTSGTSATSSMSMTSTSGAAGSIASSISSQAASITSSASTGSSTGAAATVGSQAVDMQAFLWVVMAFWLGNAVFGGRRWRW